MSDDNVEEQGRGLRDELDGERRKAGADHRWRYSSDVRERVVAYAVACSADGESHGRVAERLGVGQGTLSRWIRRRRRAKVGVRPVAIVPAGGRHAAPPGARAPLRLVSPRGFVVLGLGRGPARLAAAGPRVIRSTRSVRVFVYGSPADMRRGFDGLYDLVRERLKADPLSGDLFLFIASNWKRAEFLLWDGTGLCLYAKRLVARWANRRDLARRDDVLRPTLHAGRLEDVPAASFLWPVTHARAKVRMTLEVKRTTTSQPPRWLWSRRTTFPSSASQANSLEAAREGEPSSRSILE